MSLLAKGLTFEVASTVLETTLFIAVFGGGVATAVPIMALSFSSGLATYTANDYALTAIAAPDEPSVAAKAASFRALSLLRSAVTASVLGHAKPLATFAYTATFSVLVSVR